MSPRLRSDSTLSQVEASQVEASQVEASQVEALRFGFPMNYVGTWEISSRTRHVSELRKIKKPSDRRSLSKRSPVFLTLPIPYSSGVTTSCLRSRSINAATASSAEI
nr:hypothetical protein [Baaleninema simplex]